MNTEHTSGIPRRSWRMAAVVFLTVFLAGTGLSGAAALWSQQARVATTVTTGTWSHGLDPSWSWNPTITARKLPGGSSHPDVEFDWEPVESGSNVTYTWELTPVESGRIHDGPRSGTDGSSVRYTLHQNWIPATFELKLTAVVDDVPSRPVTLTVSISNDGNPSLR